MCLGIFGDMVAVPEHLTELVWEIIHPMAQKVLSSDQSAQP